MKLLSGLGLKGLGFWLLGFGFWVLGFGDPLALKISIQGLERLVFRLGSGLTR